MFARRGGGGDGDGFYNSEFGAPSRSEWWVQLEGDSSVDSDQEGVSAACALLTRVDAEDGVHLEAYLEGEAREEQDEEEAAQSPQRGGEGQEESGGQVCLTVRLQLSLFAFNCICSP
jgi:hypothetical protein